MEPIITSGRVEGGKLQVRNRKWLEGRLRKLRDCEVSITVERLHATRSLAQNAWYFGVVLAALEDHTGYGKDELHELMKQMHLPRHRAICDGNGEVKGEFVIGGTTTRLNKVEFGEYCERIRKWAAEQLGVNIPDPNEDHA